MSMGVTIGGSSSGGKVYRTGGTRSGGGGRVSLGGQTKGPVKQFEGYTPLADILNFLYPPPEPTAEQIYQRSLPGGATVHPAVAVWGTTQEQDPADSKPRRSLGVKFPDDTEDGKDQKHKLHRNWEMKRQTVEETIYQPGNPRNFVVVEKVTAMKMTGPDLPSVVQGFGNSGGSEGGSVAMVNKTSVSQKVVTPGQAEWDWKFETSAKPNSPTVSSYSISTFIGGDGKTYNTSDPPGGSSPPSDISNTDDPEVWWLDPDSLTDSQC